MKKKIRDVENLRNLFWDYNWESVLENLNSPFVISRVLEMGGKEEVKIFLKKVGHKEIRKFLKNYGSKLLSEINYNFWVKFYEKKIDKRTSKCH